MVSYCILQFTVWIYLFPSPNFFSAIEMIRDHEILGTTFNKMLESALTGPHGMHINFILTQATPLSS